jgi:hypothetical protein
MSKKRNAIPRKPQTTLRPDVLAKLKREVRRLANNGTAIGQGYAHELLQKYPELVT